MRQTACEYFKHEHIEFVQLSKRCTSSSMPRHWRQMKAGHLNAAARVRRMYVKSRRRLLKAVVEGRAVHVRPETNS